MRRWIGSACAALAAALTTCKTDTGPGTRVVAHFLNGPTAATTGPSAPRSIKAPGSPLSVPTNGDWLLSPDKMTLTLTHASLHGAAQSSGGAVSCAVTYDRSRPGLAQLGDCPFQVAPGTYTTLDLCFSQTIQALINDPVNGFYSTPTGVVTAAPAGGASVLAYTVAGTNPFYPGEFCKGLTLPQVLRIADTSLVSTLSVVIDAAQSFFVYANAGAVTLGYPGTGYVDPGFPNIVGAVGATAAVEFYVSQALGTDGSYCATNTTPGSSCPVINARVVSVKIYYGSASVPIMVGPAPGGGNAACNPFAATGTFLNDPTKSLVGLDAGGYIAWANPADSTYTSYTAELRMARVTTLNGTTTLYCQNISGNPAPPGGSFASGAPNIATPANSLGTYILVAH
jgi:hypothetical protein